MKKLLELRAKHKSEAHKFSLKASNEVLSTSLSLKSEHLLWWLRLKHLQHNLMLMHVPLRSDLLIQANSTVTH